MGAGRRLLGLLTLAYWVARGEAAAETDKVPGGGLSGSELGGGGSWGLGAAAALPLEGPAAAVETVAASSAEWGMWGPSTQNDSAAPSPSTPRNASADHDDDSSTSLRFKIVTKFVVSHAVTMNGVNPDVFNTNNRLIQAFVDAIATLVHVKADNVHNVIAADAGANPLRGDRLLLSSSNAFCHVNYDIYLDSIGMSTTVQNKIIQMASERISPSGARKSAFMITFKKAMLKNNVAPDIASIIEGIPASNSTLHTVKVRVEVQTSADVDAKVDVDIDVGLSPSSADDSRIAPGPKSDGSGESKPPKKYSPSPSRTSANETRVPVGGWRKGMRQESFIIIVSTFSGAGLLMALVHGASDLAAGCCGHPKFKKVRVTKFLDMKLVHGEKMVTADADNERVNTVERDFAKGEENLQADIAADAAAAHERLLERLKRGSRRINGERRRSQDLTDGSLAKAHPLTRRPTEIERLRRLHSSNMKAIHSQSIFDKDGDGDVDDEDLDIDGDGIVDDTEREMGRLAVMSAESQRAMLRQQEADRLKSEHRLDARLRQRRRASLAAMREGQSNTKVVPSAQDSSSSNIPTVQHGTSVSEENEAQDDQSFAV